MAGLEERLFTQGTDFRTLKYGKDRPGGGSSREPFVNRNTLPGLTEQSPDLGLLGGNTDFLLRAGTLKRSADDVSRITQFFTTGKGLSFVAKQNLLSRTNVKTQAQSIGLNAGPYVPTSTIAQVGVDGLGFHLNKQGLNPFAATGLDSGNDGTGGGLFQNLLNAGSIPTYLSADIKGGDSGDTNRLVQLKNNKVVGFGGRFDASLPSFFSQGTRLVSGLAGAADRIFGTDLKSKVNDLIPNLSPELAANSISNARNEILAYGGGPGSEIGVGRTRIKRSTFSDDYDTAEFRKNYYLLDYGKLESLSEESVKNKNKILPDFRQQLLSLQQNGRRKNIISDSPDYTRKNIEQRVGLGNPGTSEKDLTSYSKGTGNGAVDKVNALPLYSSTGVTASPVKNDLVKFRIAVYNPHDSKQRKTFIHFRAFLETFQDNYTSEWNPFKYMGRSEEFYKYQGFNRSVSLSWKLAAQSREELVIMYKKLNYLQSVMTGDYSPNGYMEGNIVNLTVGGYFWEQPGFFTALNVTFPEKTTYEIGIPDPVVGAERNTGQSIETRKDVKEVPHILDVSATFTPIQNFVPRKQQNKFDSKGGIESYGQERFINLSSDNGNTSYDDASVDYFDPTKVAFSANAGIIPAKIKSAGISPITNPNSTNELRALANQNFSKGLG
jgi:hypothetical protein